jgi:hypothetical protein
MTLEDRIAELEDRVAYLESELGLALDLERIDALRTGLRVTNGHAHMLLALHDRGGRPLSVLQLHDRIPELRTRSDRSSEYVRAVVYQVRQRLGADVLLACSGGYRLSPRGFILVDQVLQPVRAAA